MLLKLAWRNIWRNKRRTGLTLASILFAVLLAIIIRSLQFGSYEQMIKNMVGRQIGYIQIHSNGYWNEPSLMNSFSQSDTAIANQQWPKSVLDLVPRIESFALAAHQEKSKPVYIIGIDPTKEEKLTNPQEFLIKGRFLDTSQPNEIILSEGLSSYLNCFVGDTLALIGEGYQGQSAAGLFTVVGIVKLGSPEFNRRQVYLSLPDAQYFFGAEDRITALSILISSADETTTITQSLKKNLSSNYEVMSWQEMLPELVQSLEADNISGMITLLVLYVVVGFGIFSTLLMMLSERAYEIGVMLSIGMSRIRLTSMIIIETLLLGLLGSSLGALISIPIVWVYSLNPIQLDDSMSQMMESYGMEPIIPLSSDPSILFAQMGIVLCMVLVVCLYPIAHIHSIKPIKAMRE